MELFRSNKREKPDIEFITKAKLKKLEIVPPKKGRDGNIFIPRLASEEPQMQSRWLLRVAFENGIAEFWTTFARPTQRQDRHEIPFMSTSTWTAGRMRWDDVYLEIRDCIGDGSEEKLMEWMRAYSQTVTGRQGYAAGYKKDVEVEMIDPTGIVVEKWVLSGCMITETRFHQEMDEMDPIIGLNLSIDRAILIT